MKQLRVSASITSDDQELVTRAAEAFHRAAIGLALEGCEVFVTIGPDDVDENAELEAEGE